MNRSHPDRGDFDDRPPIVLRGLRKRFGDLKVRPKLMILHNIFFLVLTCGVYLSVIPPFEARLSHAEARETGLIRQLFAEGRPLPESGIYRYREGAAESLEIPADVRQWLDRNPGAVYAGPTDPGHLYRLDPVSGTYRRAETPHAFYSQALSRARWSLIAVLGAIYAASVLLLELVIMPTYVYRPLSVMLEADEAAHRDDKRRELIDPSLISGDEIGRIMRSRNATVSELRKHEADLAAALERLEEANRDLIAKNEMLESQDRLVSLGMMSASVAHELNTPLAVLHGSIEKLIETIDDTVAQERLGRMVRVTRRLQKISEGLLDFARVRKRDTQPVAVPRIIEESWALVGIDEKASMVRFANNLSADHIVTGNSDRLVQVFVNLLRNALGAVKSNGVISVDSREFEEQGRKWIAVRVQDDGSGIPADVLPHLFEAFVTSRLDARGTGLGLTVAEGIVHQHGGTIEASNRPGGGACLEVRLPAAPMAVS